jgi:hypothetical protein
MPRMPSCHQFVAYTEPQVISTDHHSHSNHTIRGMEPALWGLHFWQGLFTLAWVEIDPAGGTYHIWRRQQANYLLLNLLTIRGLSRKYPAIWISRVTLPWDQSVASETLLAGLVYCVTTTLKNLLTFNGDFSFGKSQKSQGAKFGL